MVTCVCEVRNPLGPKKLGEAELHGEIQGSIGGDRGSASEVSP